MSAAAAAKAILDGVRVDAGAFWLGDDAHRLDARVRETPEQACDAEVLQGFRRAARLALG